jgi:hypothetical protein
MRYAIIGQNSWTLMHNSGRELWRRGWDSNPRYGFPHARFRGEYFQPLSHLSAVVASSIVTEASISGQCATG